MEPGLFLEYQLEIRSDGDLYISEWHEGELPLSGGLVEMAVSSRMPEDVTSTTTTTTTKGDRQFEVTQKPRFLSVDQVL